jgi:hypothetical protein
VGSAAAATFKFVAADAELKALRRLRRARAALARGLTGSLGTVIGHLPSLRRHVTAPLALPVLEDMDAAAARVPALLDQIASEPTRKAVHELANLAAVLDASVSELRHSPHGPEADNLLAVMATAMNRSRRQFKAIRALLR